MVHSVYHSAEMIVKQKQNTADAKKGRFTAPLPEKYKWLQDSAQNKYQEFSSCSNFLYFQAKYGSIRYRPRDSKKSQLVHTFIGIALAVGKTLAAIFENYQQQDGTIKIPEILRPYFENRL